MAPAASADVVGPPQQVAGGLQTPWEVVVTPDGRTMVTELPGRVRLIGPGGALTTVYTAPGNDLVLGMAMHPAYAQNRFVYVFIVDPPADRGGAPNPNGGKVVRLTDTGTALTSPQVVFGQGIRIGGGHDGGRISFGPDGKLYVTTGDAYNPDLPQDLDSLNGKILRLEADGSAPADNPFNAPGEARNRRFVWSYGHRHPQGIDWDAAGRMWSTEHGPSGILAHEKNLRSRDELNRIDAGANYGWPVIYGEQTAPDMRSPVRTSGETKETTWAPGGLAFGADGRLYAPLLAGQRLLDFGVAGDTVTDQRDLFAAGPGRLRDATSAGGFLYLTTSNSTTTADEKVLRVPFATTAGSLGLGPAAPALETSGAQRPVTQTPAPSGASRLKRLVASWATLVRRAGPARLRRTRGLRLPVSGLPAGTLTVRLERAAGTAGKSLTVATGTARVSTRGSARLNLKPTGRGSAALRKRGRKSRLVLRAALRRNVGGRVSATRSLVLRAP